MKKIEETKEYKKAVREYNSIGRDIVVLMREYKKSQDLDEFKDSLNEVWNRLRSMEYQLVFDEDFEGDMDEHGYHLEKPETGSFADLQEEWFKDFLDSYDGKKQYKITVRGSGGLLWTFIPDEIAFHNLDEYDALFNL